MRGRGDDAGYRSLVSTVPGVRFPGDGSTSATGRAILAAAAAAVDADLADRIEETSNWRRGYARHVYDLTAASAAGPDAPARIAQAGLRALHERMEVERGGSTWRLTEGLDLPSGPPLSSRVVRGERPPQSELRVPYRGRELGGRELERQLDAWVQDGVVEDSFADAIRAVSDHPQWLALPGRRIAIIGAGSEMGPLGPLSTWGADVLAIDLPGDAVWDRIEAVGRSGAGTIAVPVDAGGARGIDLTGALPEVRAWLSQTAGELDLVLGMYAYADGGDHVRVTAAADVLAVGLLRDRPGTALAYLATPTDAYVVPQDVVDTARGGWAARRVRRLTQAPLRALSGERLFAPAYEDGVPVADVLVTQQGPNYALAKRLQRWRGVLAAGEDHPVSFNVAPATWTRSVTKNRALKAAYAGAHHFGVEIFAPETCRVLMAAMLVHDLHQPHDDAHPEALFSRGAAHGGLWRSPYAPRSVLPVAAVAGVSGALRSSR